MSEDTKETLSLPKKSHTERKKRIPVSGDERNVLTVRNKEPGFVYRFVNNVSDRIQKFMDAGYEPVSRESAGAIGDRRVDSSEGTSSIVEKSVGLGQKAILMRQPEEFYSEDQQTKQKRVDDLEVAMKHDAKQGRYGKLDVEDRRTP